LASDFDCWPLPAARAHAGPNAKLDSRSFKGSFSESLTTRTLKSVFENDKLHVASFSGRIPGQKEADHALGGSLVTGEYLRRVPDEQLRRFRIQSTANGIWKPSEQPCGLRLKATLPLWTSRNVARHGDLD
jgi:hypothetical protein